MHIRLGLATIVAALFLSACSTNNAAFHDIDRFVDTTLQTLPEIPSIGLAVVHDGKSYVRGYGYANLERGEKATANTGYYNGSNTKAYTATLCAMLAQQGRIDLDAPVTTYIPELRFPPPIDPAKMTLRRFLSHRSAIQNPGIVFRTAYSGEHTPAELVRLLGLSKPGKDEFRYDNLGYIVASLVIERVTGLKWQDALRQYLFQPLGMNRTTAYMSEARRYPIASPYDMNDSGVMRYLEFGYKDDSMMHAAGGIVTTPADLAKWLTANLTAAPAYLETQRQQTPAKRSGFVFNGDGYGFGWYQSTLHGEKAIYHGGGFEGWRSVYSFMPERKIAVGAMTNAGLSHSPLELISGYIYARLLNVPDAGAIYAAKLKELRARFDTVKKNQIADAQKRAQRKWTLQHPLEKYTGRYESASLGDMTIALKSGKLVASVGRLSSELQPFDEPESARIELAPGTGEVIRFVFTTSDTPDALQWDDETLTRH